MRLFSRLTSGIVAVLFTGAVTVALAQTMSKQIISVGGNPNLPFSPAVKAGGFIYVSGTLGTDASGAVAKGDIKAQTKQTLENISATLKAGGSSLANAASVMIYLRSAADFAAMNEVYATYFPKDPPARTTVVVPQPLANADGLVEIAMVAVPNGGERVVVHPTDWIKSPNPYSYGIKSGNTLFLSGLVSRNGKDNTTVKGDVATQAKVVLDNGAAILKQAGMSFADVVTRTRLPPRRHDLSGDERRLSDVLRRWRAARTRDRQGRPVQPRLRDRDHDGRGEGRRTESDHHAERRWIRGHA